jgi:hypothetical protein
MTVSIDKSPLIQFLRHPLDAVGITTIRAFAIVRSGRQEAHTFLRRHTV